MRTLAAAALVLAAAAASAKAEEDSPVVATEEGLVSGLREESTKGRTFYSYYGIPFAKPPLGNLRLQDPEATKSWEGVLDGSKMPEICLQVPSDAAMGGIKVPPEVIVGDEDCLYLNVFTPTAGVDGGRSDLPVMVWLHGGGFVFGSAQEYLPHVLMHHDVVLVVVQYRLGILGFLSTEDSAIPGNFGLKDQTLALKWVQRNINNFGGDKTKVTIFGESAGGASVHFHMLSPKSKGLFSRAILMSGTALCPWAVSRVHDQTSKKVGKKLHCPIHSGSLVLLRCLQNLDARELSVVSQDLPNFHLMPLYMAAYIDGDYLPDEPSRLVKEGRAHPVDVMAGVVSHEGILLAMPAYNQAHLLEGLETNFEELGPASLQFADEVHEADPVTVANVIYKHYFGDVRFDARKQEQFIQLMSDRHFMVSHDWMTQYQAKIQAPGKKTYRYELTYHAQLSVGDLFGVDAAMKWVSHCDDLYYLFRGGPLLQPPQQPPERLHDLQSKDDLALRDIFTTLWTNFAATGNPTPNDSLGFIWEPSTADNLHYLDLKPRPTMEEDQRQEVRSFYASLPSKVNVALHPHLMKDLLEEEEAKTTTGYRRDTVDEL